MENNTGVDWINKNFRLFILWPKFNFLQTYPKQLLRLCSKSQLKTHSDVRTLKDYLTEIWTDLAMMVFEYFGKMYLEKSVFWEILKR